MPMDVAEAARVFKRDPSALHGHTVRLLNPHDDGTSDVPAQSFAHYLAKGFRDPALVKPPEPAVNPQRVRRKRV